MYRDAIFCLKFPWSSFSLEECHHVLFFQSVSSPSPLIIAGTEERDSHEVCYYRFSGQIISTRVFLTSKKAFSNKRTMSMNTCGILFSEIHRVKMSVNAWILDKNQLCIQKKYHLVISKLPMLFLKATCVIDNVGKLFLWIYLLSSDQDNYSLQPSYDCKGQNPSTFVYTVCPEKSVTLTISENIPKPRNKFWIFFNCTDTPNPWPKHMWVLCKLSHASLHKIQNLSFFHHHTKLQILLMSLWMLLLTRQ